MILEYFLLINFRNNPDEFDPNENYNDNDEIEDDSLKSIIPDNEFTKVPKYRLVPLEPEREIFPYPTEDQFARLVF